MALYLGQFALVRYNLHIVYGQILSVQLSKTWICMCVCVCAHTYLVIYKLLRTFPSPLENLFLPLPSHYPRDHRFIPKNCHSEPHPHRLDLPLHKLPTKIKLQYMLFCIWLLWLNIMYLRFTHVVACLHSTDFLTTE